MKNIASNFTTRQHMAAVMRYKLGHVLQYLFFHFIWLKVSMLKGCVAILCEMEACTEQYIHSLLPLQTN
jgi:hypothetical protein